MCRSILYTLVCLLLAPNAGQAQRSVSCEGGFAGCTYLQAGGQPVTIKLRIAENDRPDRTPTTILSNHGQHFASPMIPNEDGSLSLVWRGVAASDNPGEIVVRAGAALDDPHVTILILPHGAPRATPLLSATDSVVTQFAGWELRQPLTVVVEDGNGGHSLPEPSCRRTRVSFRTISPDPPSETLVNAVHGEGRCTASLHWTTRDRPGIQRVAATVEGHPHAEARFRVNVRRQARVIFGVTAVRGGRSFATAEIDTVYFTTGTHGDDTDPYRVEAAITPSEGEDKTDFRFEPMVGVDLPLLGLNAPFAQHLRFSVAVAPSAPRTRVFTGLSILQLALGLPQESTLLDTHVGVHFSSVESHHLREICVEEAGALRCRVGLDTSTAWGWDGFSLMATLDGSSLLSTIIGRITGG
jgi:hypothetical protein